MMIARNWVLAGAALALAACDGGGGNESYAPAAPRGGVAMDKMESAEMRLPNAPTEEPAPEAGAEAGVMLAYSYSMGVMAPKGRWPL